MQSAGETAETPRSQALQYLAKAGPAIQYFLRRDLLEEDPRNLAQVWALPEVRRLLRKQNSDGSWGKPGGYPDYHRPLLETFKRLRLLIGRYELNNSVSEIRAASEFLFSTQTSQGDFRGMIGDQYATYYTGEFSSLLIRAGYNQDPRIDTALQWLLAFRQDDGGWTIPMLTRPTGGGTAQMMALTGEPADPLEPDRSQPFSHNWTDMVLRAFAAHPRGRLLPEARKAGDLLKSRFFRPDVYHSYRNPNYWIRFVHWWPNLLTSLESLSLLGFSAEDEDIAAALRWFREHQQVDGSWKTSYFPGNAVSTQTELRERPWVTLRVARLFKSFGAVL